MCQDSNDMVCRRFSCFHLIALFVIAGNHDGPERIEVGRTMLAQSKVFVWGTPEHCQKPLLYDFEDGVAAICAIPFSEPRRIAHSLQDVFDDNNVAYHDYDFVYQQWSDYLVNQIPRGMRSIALSHIFASGGEIGGSERTISVGASEVVKPSVFTPFNYTALGHLHRSQRMGSDYIRYSGSLLKYSFDEYTQNKSFTIVDMNTKGKVEIETIPIVSKRDVVVLEDYFDNLLNNELLRNTHENDYVMVRLLDTTPVLDGMAKLRQCFPHCMTLELVGRMEQQSVDVTEPIYRNLDERQLFCQFAKAVWKEPLSQEQQAYMDRLWERIVKED